MLFDCKSYWQKFLNIFCNFGAKCAVVAAWLVCDVLSSEKLKLTQLCLFGFEAGKLHMSKTSLIASTFLLRSGGEVRSTRFSRSIRKVLSLPILPIRAPHQTRIKARYKIQHHYIENHIWKWIQEFCNTIWMALFKKIQNFWIFLCKFMKPYTYL